ncbi:MAG: DNA-binding protein [Thermoplasmata archaeon]|nr:DNA-binding protein [Thermoplasmata archaeon]
MTITRELAWRVFAKEYNESSYMHSDGGDRTPSYLITPLGAKINRLFIVGVVTEIENIGTDGKPNWRARVSDRTGTFFVYAGQYDPEVAQQLVSLEPPAFVAVIGKPRIYRPENGTVLVSIRPERVQEVSRETCEYWMLETCKQMRSRLGAVKEAMTLDPPTVDKLISLGFDPKLAEGVVLALQNYDHQKIDLEQYIEVLVGELNTLTEVNNS